MSRELLGTFNSLGKYFLPEQSERIADLTKTFRANPKFRTIINEEFRENCSVFRNHGLIKPDGFLRDNYVVLAACFDAALRSSDNRIEAEKESRTDYLTGALSKRGLDEALCRIFQRYPPDVEHRPSPYYYAMAMLDVDRFKWYDDKLSHSKADVILQEIVSLTNTLIRTPFDLIARPMGDEFVLLLTISDYGNRDPQKVGLKRLEEIAGFLNSLVTDSVMDRYNRNARSQSELMAPIPKVTLSYGAKVFSHPETIIDSPQELGSKIYDPLDIELQHSKKLKNISR
ncbi:diguanylate cyclase [Patescibacteria group bacterium]|nr:diguanylate cyclase [Patescibacteria group bacterium]